MGGGGRGLLAGPSWEELVGRGLLAGSWWEGVVGRVLVGGACWQNLNGRSLLGGPWWEEFVGRTLVGGVCWQGLGGRGLLVVAFEDLRRTSHTLTAGRKYFPYSLNSVRPGSSWPHEVPTNSSPVHAKSVHLSKHTFRLKCPRAGVITTACRSRHPKKKGICTTWYASE